MDLLLSTVALLALAPLIAVVALLVKGSSAGPVFFRQQRVGRDGTLFWLYKFRTMRPAAGGPAITSAGDTRITRVGRVLRQWKLDELPQLLNILRGEMSLVGPRPEVPQYVRLYSPEQRGVLDVRPGITGPSQIRFRDEETLLAAQPDPELYYHTALLPAKLAIDLEYARHHHLLGDLQLIAGTVRAVCRPSTPPSQVRGLRGSRRLRGRRALAPRHGTRRSRGRPV